MTKKINVDLRKVAFAIILLIGISQCARVYGMSEYNIAVLESVTYIILVLIVAVIVWYVYRLAIERLLNWFDDSVDSGDKSGLYPLLSVLGTLFIALGSVWIIMSHMGIDLLVILTSAGIIGLAITFGAQSTLSQFFSGLNLLMSRPFKAGDVIRLNNTHITYRVRKIGLMNTILEEWDTNEPYTFPNNQLSGAIVNNVTGEQKAFCAIVFLDIHYMSDLVRVKELMTKAAEMTQHIILDGTKPYPEVSFVEMTTTHVKAKLSAYGNDFEHNGKVISDLTENIVTILKENDIGYSPPRYDVKICRED